MPERAGDRADQPVAAERDRDLAAGGGLEGERARMLEAFRVLKALLEPEFAQDGLDLWECARRAPPAGHGVNDQ